MNGQTIIQPPREGIWPSIISIIVPLVQLLLMASTSISNFLNIARFFFSPELLPLVNILTVIVTLSLIGFFWYRKENRFILIKTELNKKGEKIIIPPEKKIFQIINILLILSFLSFLIFIAAVILFITPKLIVPEIILGIIQYISYSSFFTSTGLLIFIWISEYARKKQSFQREDFIRNLINTLGKHNIIIVPKIKIWRNQLSQGSLSKFVELEVERQRYIVIASFDGLEIFEIYKKEEHEKLTRSQQFTENLKSLTTQELESLVKKLEKQLEDLKREQVTKETNQR